VKAVTPIPTQAIDEVLADLPSLCTVASAGEARLVFGPSGAFVLLDGSDDPADSADRAGRLAASTRGALAEHVSWVPFIDAVIVTPRARNGGDATPVPLDLLREVLVEGPPVIEPMALDTFRELLAHGRLASWRAGLNGDAGKIDLCEPPAGTSIR
jgi:hypothetical protein